SRGHESAFKAQESMSTWYDQIDGKALSMQGGIAAATLEPAAGFRDGTSSTITTGKPADGSITTKGKMITIMEGDSTRIEDLNKALSINGEAKAQLNLTTVTADPKAVKDLSDRFNELRDLDFSYKVQQDGKKPT